MLKIKDKSKIVYSAFMVCLIDECQEEASKLWATETNIIDVCEMHHKELQAEKY